MVGGGESYTVTPDAFAAMIVDLDRQIADLLASELADTLLACRSTPAA